MSQPTNTLSIGSYGYILDDFDIDEAPRAHAYTQHRAAASLAEFSDTPGRNTRHALDANIYSEGATADDYHVAVIIDGTSTATLAYDSTVSPSDWVYSASSPYQDEVWHKGVSFESYPGGGEDSGLNTDVLRFDFYGIGTARNTDSTAMGCYIEQFQDNAISEVVQLADHSAGDELYAPYEFISAWHMKNLYGATYNRLTYECLNAYSFGRIKRI